MPAIKIKIPRADRSAYPPSAENSREIRASIKRQLLHCLSTESSPKPKAIGAWVPCDLSFVWTTEEEAEPLDRIKSTFEFESLDDAASALLHGWARENVDASDPESRVPAPPTPPEPEPHAWRIEVSGSLGIEVLHWMILDETEKALRVDLPGGSIWMPKHLARARRVSLHNLEAFLQDLRELTSGDELVRLYSPRENKSGSLHALVITEAPLSEKNRLRTRKRGIWLPVSQVTSSGRAKFAPRWVVRKALRRLAEDRKFGRHRLRFARGEGLPEGQGWAGMHATERALRIALEKLQFR